MQPKYFCHSRIICRFKSLIHGLHIKENPNIGSSYCNKNALYKFQHLTPSNTALFKKQKTCLPLLLSRSSSFVKEKNSRLVDMLIEDIDMEKVKEEMRIARNKAEGDDRGNPKYSIHTFIEEELKRKCAEVIENFDPKEKRALQVIQLEYDFLYNQGYNILDPERLTNKNWLEALQLTSRGKRLNYYTFLSKRDYLKEQSRKRNEVRTPHDPEKRMDAYPHGRIFHRIYKSTILRAGDYRLCSAMQYNQPLVFDFDFEQHMAPKEIKNTGQQLKSLYHWNKDQAEPFHLHFTNCAENNAMFKMMQRYNMDLEHLFATVTEKSYLDVFDPERLIYLSPNAHKVLHHLDPDDVPIIGAFNDRGNNLPITYARARKDKIRCARLPIDDYVLWGKGAKELTLDQCVKIMYTFQQTKCWDTAFQHLPSRKIMKDPSPRSIERFSQGKRRNWR